MTVKALINKLNEFDGEAIVGVKMVNGNESIEVYGGEFEVKKNESSIHNIITITAIG